MVLRFCWLVRDSICLVLRGLGFAWLEPSTRDFLSEVPYDLAMFLVAALSRHIPLAGILTPRVAWVILELDDAVAFFLWIGSW